MNFLKNLFSKKTTAEGTNNLSIDKRFEFDIKAKDLKVLAAYSNNPIGFMSLIKTKDANTAVLKFFEYADSSFTDSITTFIDSGTLVCSLYFGELDAMSIEDAYPRIKADLTQKGQLKGGESLILLNWGFAGPTIRGFIMLIGVMVITDNKSTVNVISADKIENSKVKFNLK